MAAAEKAFELSVIIHAVDKLTGPMKMMESAMKYTQGRMDLITKSMKNMGATSKDIDKTRQALDKLARVKEFGHIADDLKKIGSTDQDIQNVWKGMEKMAAQQDRMAKASKSFKTSLGVTVAGGAMTAGGVGMAHGLMEATDEAGKMLTIMTTIRDASGATADEIDRISKTARQAASDTKYDTIETQKFAALLATSGYNAGETNSLLPIFTKFAEVQEYGKGASPEESIKTAIQMAHSAGHYDPGSLMNFLDQYNKATFMQPEDSAKFAETLKYLQPTALSMGMKDQDALFMAALANRMGLAGSMGGTNAADMLMRAIPGISGGMKQKKDGTFPKQLQAMMDMGLADSKGNSPFFSDGKLIDIQGFITTLVEKTAKFNPEERMRAYHDIFGIQGARAAQLLGSDKGFEQLQALQRGIGKNGQPGYIKGIEQMQEDYLKTPEGQINQLKGNLQNLKFNIFLEMAKTLNPLIGRMNTLVEKILTFSDQHPKLAKYIATFALIATGVLLIAGPLTSVIGLIGMMVSGLRMLAVAKGFTGILTMLRAIGAFFLTNPIGLAITGIALAAFLIYKNWGVVGPWLQRMWKGIQDVATRVWGAIGPTIMKAVNAVWGTLRSAWGRIVTFARQVWPDILKVVQIYWPPISRVILFYLQMVWTYIKFYGTVWMATFKAVWTIISTVVKVVWTAIVNVLRFAWDLISGLFRIWLKLITGDWAGAWKLFKETAVQLWLDIKKFFVDGWNGLGQIVKSIGTAAVQWGKDIVGGLIHGIKEMWDNLKNTIKDLASDKVIGPLKNMLGIHSPSKVMMDHGKYITQGLALGMTQNAKLVDNASAQLAGSALGAFADEGSAIGGNSFNGGNTIINVHPHPHQNVREIVDEIERRQGKKAMRRNMGTGFRLSPGSM